MITDDHFVTDTDFCNHPLSKMFFRKMFFSIFTNRGMFQGSFQENSRASQVPKMLSYRFQMHNSAKTPRMDQKYFASEAWRFQSKKYSNY